MSKRSMNIDDPLSTQNLVLSLSHSALDASANQVSPDEWRHTEGKSSGQRSRRQTLRPLPNDEPGVFGYPFIGAALAHSAHQGRAALAASALRHIGKISTELLPARRENHGEACLVLRLRFDKAAAPRRGWGMPPGRYVGIETGQVPVPVIDPHSRAKSC